LRRENSTPTVLYKLWGQLQLQEYYIADADIKARFYSVSGSCGDFLGIQVNSTLGGTTIPYYIRVSYNSFTGFHRVYTDDELNQDNDIFKNDYMGRIVISTGKIKTDVSKKIDDKTDEWISKEDKEGILIEDALPIIQLSRKKKDKRVFGVLGDPNRINNNQDRFIVNSMGEGAICVCNTNGNIENGDYIQSSDLLGYGEKQDDDLLHNYTVAKSIIDCDFELNSPYYQCYEIENGVRVAFIASTYHCGLKNL
jgi:hypothetical protein